MKKFFYLKINGICFHLIVFSNYRRKFIHRIALTVSEQINIYFPQSIPFNYFLPMLIAFSR